MKFRFKTDFPALKAGDKLAFNNLMEDFYAWSCDQARFTIRDSERSKDVALTFWETLSDTIQSFDPKKASFQAWASVCIKNLAIKEITRARKPVVYYGNEENDPSIDDPMLRLEALQDFDAVVERLKPGQEQDVFWRLVEGVSTEEIAEELGVSVKRARNIVGKVRDAIKTQLEE